MYEGFAIVKRQPIERMCVCVSENAAHNYGARKFTLAKRTHIIASRMYEYSGGDSVGRANVCSDISGDRRKYVHISIALAST